MFSVDRFGRAVGEVFVKRHGVWWNVGLGLVNRGYADVYRQFGAEYGGSKQYLERGLLNAKRKKKGMWSDVNVVVPSLYKKDGK